MSSLVIGLASGGAKRVGRRLRLVCAKPGRSTICSERSPPARGPAGERLFESVRRLPALVVEVGLDIGPLGRQQEAPDDVRDRAGQHELPVGVEGEAVALPVVDDPPAGPVFVFEAAHETEQASVGAASCASPPFPDGVVPVGEGQEVAVRLGAIERDARAGPANLDRTISGFSA